MYIIDSFTVNSAIKLVRISQRPRTSTGNPNTYHLGEFSYNPYGTLMSFSFSLIGYWKMPAADRFYYYYFFVHTITWLYARRHRRPVENPVHGHAAGVRFVVFLYYFSTLFVQPPGLPGGRFRDVFLIRYYCTVPVVVVNQIVVVVAMSADHRLVVRPTPCRLLLPPRNPENVHTGPCQLCWFSEEIFRIFQSVFGRQ